MVDQIPRLNDLFQEILDLGLWTRGLSPPEPSVLERIYNIDKDLYRRLVELSIPEDQLHLLEEEREIYQNEKAAPRATKSKKKKTNWISQKRKNIMHLGKSVSGKLNMRDENTKELKKKKLPSLKTTRALTNFTKTNKKSLVTLCYHRRVSEYSNYIDFKIPKKTGGYREISAPKPYLKEKQYYIKEQILDKLQLPEYVTGFYEGRSIKDNADIHIGANLIINFDITDFFPSINYYRVRAFFMNLGYSGQSATVLALITTKPIIKKVTIGTSNYYTFSENRYLPQGAPTSPQLANHIATRMDEQIISRIKPLGFVYSRYADDITISIKEKPAKIKAAMSIVIKTVEMHGFSINKKKVKVLPKEKRQEITGLVINSGNVNISRTWRRNLRARLHVFVKYGVGDINELSASIAYLNQFHPKSAESMLNKLKSAKS